MTPWLDDGDVRLYHGDCLDVLQRLPEGGVDCCVTSPPYWGLRDYGVDGQLGLESTPQEYVARMVEVFRAVRRVLRDDGTLWLNLGDTYNAYNGNSGAGGPVGLTQSAQRPRLKSGHGLLDARTKPKDLVGIPWRVAFALQDDGWYLRSDIIWSKPNPMPESVTDRPTKSHEYVFLLSKRASYFFGQDAVREPYRYDGRRVLEREAGPGSHDNHRNGKRNRWPGISAAAAAARRDVLEGGAIESEPMDVNHAGRNVRSVWEIPTRPFPGAHFAVFPPDLARRCVLAGSREDGTVLDPFAGSGTTLKVARDHGRHSVGIELNEAYLRIAADRLAQQSLLTGDAA